jgi:RNA polymerase sigma-70 factor (ECF subfamily)
MEAYFDAGTATNTYDELIDDDYAEDVSFDEKDDIDEEHDADEEVETQENQSKSSMLPIAANVLRAGPRAQDDQEILFRELMRDHQKRLYRFVIRYIDHPDDAADITQQAFAEAARTISTFRGDSKLSTWLYGIAMNMVRNYLSRAPHRVYRFESDEILGGLACPEPNPSESLAQKELLELVECAFAGLPPEMSKVLSLVAIDEISYQEAADILSIPLGTVRSRVSRARAVLRTYFHEAGVQLIF